VLCHVVLWQVEEIEAAVKEGRAGTKGKDKDPRFRRVPKPEQVFF
jgi:hypothetical protein